MKNIYTFDKVFNPSNNNSAVFEKSTLSLIDNVLSGFNASVMLYGVTGSGKTHTVFGKLGHSGSKDTGLIYLALKDLLNREGVAIKLSYLEIYNEVVKDLLSGEDNLFLMDKNDEVVVQGLTQVQLEGLNQVEQLVLLGNKRRKMAKTNSNQFSSRSHSIIQLQVRKKQGEGYIESKLSFIDLAGSERVSLTENKGLRMMEGSNINKSLLALGKVITSLSQKTKGIYIPYRDSKLTRLLKDSLGGNTKTVLIACITPNKIQIDETIHSLNYASRAKKIKNKITKNEFKKVNFFKKRNLTFLKDQSHQETKQIKILIST